MNERLSRKTIRGSSGSSIWTKTTRLDRRAIRPWPARRIKRLEAVAATFGLCLALGGFGSGLASRILQAADLPEDRQEAILSLNHADPRTCFSVALEVAGLPPDYGWKLVESSWSRLTNVDARCQMLKAFYYEVPYPLRPRFHPHLLSVLALGLSDGDEKVRSWARTYLQKVSFRAWESDLEAREAVEYCRKNRDRPILDLVRESIQAWETRTRNLRGGALASELELFDRNGSLFRDVVEAREEAQAAGLVERFGGWARGLDVEVAKHSLRILGRLGLGEAELRPIVVPVFDSNRPSAVRAAAFSALAGEENRWAVEDLVSEIEELVFRRPRDRTVLWAATSALGRIGDRRAIPRLIASIDAAPSYDTIYGIGYFALTRLTGVEYEESHDGAWWRNWWEENRSRFSAEVAALSVPTLARTDSEAAPSVRDLPDAEDVAHRKAQDRRAGGDESKRYLLIGGDSREAPPEGFAVLLVLPGGDGSVDFHPFVKRLFERCCPAGVLMAQLVAPRWSADQFEKKVWPTEENPWPGMQFSTEEFAMAVLRDLERDYSVDESAVMTLSWSSGGPAAYAISLASEARVSGSLIAMSVFRPEWIGGIENLDHSYYLYHSPEDFIPIRMARDARDQLKSRGARVVLEEYEGGHGFRGGCFASLENGLDWLLKAVRR